MSENTINERPANIDLVSIDLFAADMRRKMRANSHKPHWSQVSFDHLFSRLREEMSELEQAFMSGAVWNEVVDECADVGNIAMMIADKMRGYNFGKPEQP
jgi:NTP pyrophosphatase (non-canonical NTP hydrolase)